MGKRKSTHNFLYAVCRVLYAALRSRFIPQTEHLILHVTGRCNLKCSHCFAYPYRKSRDLSFEEIKKIAEVVPNPIWLDIGGGEPFFRKDLAKICCLFNAERIMIPTNGQLTGQITSIAKKLAAHKPGKVTITVSLDGFRNTHDSIRGKGSFDRAIKTFKALRKVEGLGVGFSTTLSSKNSGEIVDFVKEMSKNNPDFHGVVLLRGKPRDKDFSLPPINTIYKIEKDLSGIIDDAPFSGGLRGFIEKNFVSHRRHIAFRTLKERKQTLPCFAGRLHLVIFPNGDVSPCELLPPVGNIRNEELEEIKNGQMFRQSLRKISSGDCYCTHECNMLDNILLNPSQFVYLVKARKW